MADKIEQAKRAAAYRAVDAYVKDNMVRECVDSKYSFIFAVFGSVPSKHLRSRS
jgi:hypothetical protein